MNGYLNIELAHEHQQSLIEHAARTRLASRVAGTVRPASLTRWRRRRSARSDVVDAPVRQFAAAGCSRG